jgi:formylglycine-generating enzyme required for sulfatase activity
MKARLPSILPLAILGLLVMGCDDLLTSSDKSSDKAITAFAFSTPAATGVITEASHAVAVTVPLGTNVTALVPTITHTGASISPASGTAQNFTSPVTYTVTASDASTQAYVVTVTINPDYISANIGALKYVPAGSFQRDATAINISTITTAYRMSAHEITRAQFEAIMVTDPGNATYSIGTGDPVQMTNWYHAIAFCNKLSLAEGLTPVYTVTGVAFATLNYAAIPITGNAAWNGATATWTNNGYRLPTEMEWMWAAMGAPADGQGGGTNTTGYAKAFAGSTGSNAIGDYEVFGYYGGEPGKTITERSNPVGSKLANELGLYDMSGNVWECCWDWYAGYPTGTETDYRGAASGSNRVLRGGSWFDDDYDCIVAYRGINFPYYQDYNFGFRVVRP